MSNAVVENMPVKRVIVDVDAGIDDAQALMLLLHGEKLGLVRVEAICCSNGNGTLENVCRNVVRLLEACGRTDIPVYKGSRKQILPLSFKYKHYHGLDAFGDLEHDTEPDISVIKDELSFIAIRRIVMENPGEISLMVLGPLTNLALAIRIFENFTTHVKSIHVMGGNHKGVGNVTATAEFNFAMDPEAASIVLSHAKCPLFLLTWECCQKSTIPFSWRYEVLGRIEKPFWKLIDRVEQSIAAQHPSHPIWVTCDPFLAVAFMFPEETIVKKQFCYASVELNGSKTRGQVVINHLNKDDRNVVIIKRINCEFFQKIMVEACKNV